MKDQFHVKGMETSMAYTGWIGTFEGRKGTGKERVFESELVKELHSLGAIIIAKVGDHVPILLTVLICESDNFGTESLGK